MLEIPDLKEVLEELDGEILYLEKMTGWFPIRRKGGKGRREAMRDEVGPSESASLEEVRREKERVVSEEEKVGEVWLLR